MSERDLSRIWFTGERERNISGALDLAVSNWAERTHTNRNIELLRFAHMLWYTHVNSRDGHFPRILHSNIQAHKKMNICWERNNNIHMLG